MNNFRPHPNKSLLGGRDLQQSSEFPDPWMTNEEMANMRRLTSQRNSFMQNMPNMQASHLHQSQMLSMSNKNYINESSCKMTGSNFSLLPNPSIFKSVPGVNETSYQNRLSDRFSYTNSLSNVNTQYKNNQASLYKDISPSMVNLPPHKSQSGLPENISRSLYSNMRQPQERFSCMQNSEPRFHSKFDNSQMFDEKEFPVATDKSLLMQSAPSFSDKMSNSLPKNFSPYKQNFKHTNLFPAYAPKETIPESSKIVQSPDCTSDFTAKSNNLICDKTEFSNKYSSALQQLKECADSYHDTRTDINDLFTEPNTSTLTFEKQPFKAVPKSQVPPDSFKQSIENVSSSSHVKFSFPSENQQTCFQNSNQIPLQKSPNLQQLSELPPTSVSKDCLMQNTPFSSQSDSDNLKNFTTSNFNFDTNLNVSDIADLLPGLDAIFKETLSKPDELCKTDLNKSNSAFSDDEWSKHSIPFIGNANQVSYKEASHSNTDKDFSDIRVEFIESKPEEYESKSKEINILKSPVINETKNELMKGVQKDSSVEDGSKVHSALEEAIEMLVKGEAIVGLDYIIEYKKGISQKASFPFKCKLCNSAISRPSIIDHILGSKHRMRYIKIKDESKYEYILSLKNEKAEKDAKITEIAQEFEKIFGRGYVIVDADDLQKDSANSEGIVAKEEETVENVLTLNQIPIGFEALSPQHDDTSSANFDLEPSLNQSNCIPEQKPDITSSADFKSLAQGRLSDSEFSLPTSVAEASSNYLSKFSISQPDSVNSSSQGNSNLYIESDIKEVKQSEKLPESEIKVEGSGVKRSASPDSSSSSSKLQKLDKLCDEITDEKKLLEIKKECETSVEKKAFDTKLFDELSKCTISSETEASIALQAINILMEMYMRYKLQHVPLELVETLMQALQSKSPDKMEEIVGLLNDGKLPDENNALPDVKTEDNNQMELDNLQVNMENKSIQEQVVLDSGNTTLKIQELNLPTSTIINSVSTPISVQSTNTTMSVLNTDTLPVSISMCPLPATLDTITNTSMSEPIKAADSVSLPNAMNSQGMNPACLKPPPFFKWPQTTEASAMMNQVSYANVQGSQNLIWATAYQQPQLQYAQIPYYQPQAFGNTYAGTQAYPTQFPVLAQNSVQINMAGPPPLPPPLPPPPPVPTESKLSHFQSSSSVPNQPISQPNPLLNASLVASFTNPPPPPPPLP